MMSEIPPIPAQPPESAHRLAPSQEQKRSPEAKRYRSALLKSLLSIRAYDGTEKSADAVLAKLMDLEEIIKANPLLPTANSFKNQEEEYLERYVRAFTENKDKKRDITALLDMAIASGRTRKAIHTSLVAPPTPEGQKSQLLYVHRLDGVILPPDSEVGSIIPGQEPMKDARFEERLFELSCLLQENKVFLDDYVVSIGDVSPKQMREESYAVVEIPRLGRTVLVCDQVGEATFVIHGLGDPKRFLRLTKEELLNAPDIQARRIIRHGLERWQEDLKRLLFTEEAWQETVEEENALEARPLRPKSQDKVDIRSFVQMREEILGDERWNSPQIWVNMTRKQVSKVNMMGRGLVGIARFFGVEGNPVDNTLPRLELARKVFGDVPVIMEAIEKETLAPDQLIEKIKQSRWNTPEAWVNMTFKQAQKVNMMGRGLNGIAHVLGVEGNPVNNTLPRLELARKVFGDAQVIMEAIGKAREKGHQRPKKT